jgi:predicted amidohydrolase YtcJ
MIASLRGHGKEKFHAREDTLLSMVECKLRLGRDSAEGGGMKAYLGTIISCDSGHRVHRALVEDSGKIAYVGDSLPPEYSKAERIELGSRALCPAFADTHIHFMSYALFSAGLDLRDAHDIASAAAAVGEFARSRRDRIVMGFGTSAHSVAEGRLLLREDLDAACPERPAFVVKYDGHAAVVNRALLAILPPALRSCRGYDAESGLMTQEAFFRTTDFVTGRVSLPATLTSMLCAVDGLASRGIGLIHSVTGVGFPGDLDVVLESLFAKGLRNELPYRVFFQTMDAEKVLRRKLPRIGGCFATALDGCFGSSDAALLEGYADDPANRGVLYYQDSVVEEFSKRANRAGLQIEMHAIGDRAFDQAVGALEAALRDFPRTDHRHTIIHACLPTDSGLDACARLGIRLAVQPSFLRWDQEPLSYLERILGKRAYGLSPLKRMRGMGIRMSGGSDGPCTLPDPIHGIWAAANHYVSGESLSVQEALDMYTVDAAAACFDEKERGSLERGKIADMVLLSENLLDVPPGQIRRVKAEGLILSGKEYRPGQGRASLIAKGLFSRRKI